MPTSRTHIGHVDLALCKMVVIRSVVLIMRWSCGAGVYSVYLGLGTRITMCVLGAGTRITMCVLGAGTRITHSPPGTVLGHGGMLRGGLPPSPRLGRWRKWSPKRRSPSPASSPLGRGVCD